MRNSTPLLKTLLVAATTVGFCATPAWADNDDENKITLSDGDTQIASDAGTTTWAGYTFVISSNILTADTWGTVGNKGAWIAWSGAPAYTPALGTSTDKVTITGSGFLGLAFQNGNGNTASTVDLTNVDASEFAGQLAVVNAWADSTTVKLSGNWSGTEYIFGSVTMEWAGISAVGTGNFNATDAENGLFTRGTSATSGHIKDEDILALQGDTTLAGVTGTSKDYSVGGINLASEDYITVASAGTTLTIAGTGTYEFYGTVGASNSGTVTRASLVMNSTDGNGKQTFGGTNYLQNVTVTSGTLALGGTTDISGGINITGGALELSGTTTIAGTVDISSAITNTGTITLGSDVVFVLNDSLINSGTTYTFIMGEGTITNWDSLNYTNFQLANGGTISARQIVFGTDGSITYNANGQPVDLVWSGENSNVWTNGGSAQNWKYSGSPDNFYTDDNVTFDNTSSNKAVSIGEAITAGTVTVSDSEYVFTFSDGGSLTTTGLTVSSGASLALSGTGTLTASSANIVGTLSLGDEITLDVSNLTLANVAVANITGTGTIVIATGYTGNGANSGVTLNSGFTGTLSITSGYLDLGYSNINSSAKLEFAAGTSVSCTVSDTTIANDISLTGSGDVHIRTSSATGVVFSGAFSSASGITIEKNGDGASSVIFTGNVDIGGTYKTYQGTTTFTDKLTIDGIETTVNSSQTININNLTVNNDGNNSSNVVFDTAGTVYIGTLDITEGSDKGSVTISGSGIYTINNLTLDNAGARLDASGLTGSLTINTLTIANNGTFTTSGTGTNGSGSIGTVNFTSGGTLAIADNSALTVGSINDTTGVAAHITVGDGSTLNVTGTITIATASAGTLFPQITGAGADKSMVIANSIVVADGTKGANLEIGNVTLIAGSISTNYSSTASHVMYLYDMTLGFTGNTTISGLNVFLGVADKNNGDNWGRTTDTVTKTTISTNKYDATGAVTTGSVDIVISSAISGAGTLIVEGSGSLTLSGENKFEGGLEIHSGATVIAKSETALGGLTNSSRTTTTETNGNVTVANGATLQLDVAISTPGTVAFEAGATLVLGDDILAQLGISTYDGDSTAVSIITANDISFGGTSVSNVSGDDLNSLVNAYVTVSGYELTWTWADGTLSASVVSVAPEPSMFGLFAGLGVIGLVATRRRRRKVA